MMSNFTRDINPNPSVCWQKQTLQTPCWLLNPCFLALYFLTLSRFTSATSSIFIVKESIIKLEQIQPVKIWIIFMLFHKISRRCSPIGHREKPHRMAKKTSQKSGPDLHNSAANFCLKQNANFESLLQQSKIHRHFLWFITHINNYK